MSDGDDDRSQFNNKSNAAGGDLEDHQVDDYFQDFKEKRKLLLRWNLYFPHEHVKDYDVRDPNIVMTLVAQ